MFHRKGASSYPVLLQLASFLMSVFLLVPRSADAFCLAPQLEVSDEFYISEQVLIGTVENAKMIRDAEDQEGSIATVYTLRVNRVLRGPKKQVRIRIYSENTTARFPMGAHHRYVLFLFRTKEGWVVDNCGNSGLLRSSSKVLSGLRQLPLKRSFVYGSVYPFAVNETCPAMQLVLQSESVQRYAYVHPDCTFRSDTPPGLYKAKLLWNGKEQPAYDLSYKNRYCFYVPKGGSAGIAFRPREGDSADHQVMLQEQEKQLRGRCVGGLNGAVQP